MAPLILALLVSLPSRAATLEERVQPVFERLASQYGLSGTLGIFRRGETYFEGVGLGDDSKKWKNGRDTIYLIASNSKEFTATVMMRLVDQGRLSVTDPVSRFFPLYPPENLRLDRHDAVVENLLEHTSGIADVYELAPIKDILFRREITFSELLDALRTQPLTFAPGSRFDYSNTGYLLLGGIIRSLTGEPYGAFLKRELLAPKGLDDTFVGLPPPAYGGRTARSYEKNGQGRDDYVEKYGISDIAYGDIFTDGNIATTAPDLLHWVLDLAEGRTLSARSTAAMFTPSAVEPYGYGWAVGADGQGRKRYSHTGAWLAFESYVEVFPDDDTAIVFLANQPLDDGVEIPLLGEIEAAAFQTL